MKKTIIAMLVLVLLCIFMIAVAEESAPDYSDVAVGDVVTFGSYEQDNNLDNGPEPIEWIVLDVQDGKALLLSKYGLDAKPYNTERKAVTWETCTLRAWLNDDFMNEAFSEKEQSAILLTDVDNSSAQCYSEWEADGGNNTQDKFFLLSYGEAYQYFGIKWIEEKGYDKNKKARCHPTPYARARKAFQSEDWKTEEGLQAGDWWLRSPAASRQDYAAKVRYDGGLGLFYVSRPIFSVRPAFWMDLRSDII